VPRVPSAAVWRTARRLPFDGSSWAAMPVEPAAAMERLDEGHLVTNHALCGSVLSR